MITDYGFQWGPMIVSRIAELRGRRVVSVGSDHHQVEVCFSPQGRNVQVWVDGKKVAP